MAADHDANADSDANRRRSKHKTKFQPLTDRPPVFGKRPHLPKEGREMANAAVGQIREADEPPPYIEDKDDVKLSDVLKWLADHGHETRQHETATLCDLLSSGLTFREAVTWYLYEHAGLTLREIYHVDAGKERSFSKERDRQAERNVAATLQSAADTLGVDADVTVGDDHG